MRLSNFHIKLGKLAFAVLALLLIGGQAWGADYYVNVSTGSDAADGSVSTPWKDVQFATDKAAAGDTIHVTAPPTAPFNHFLLPPTAGDSTDSRITISGPSPTEKAYFTYSYNVTQGNTIGNLLHNGGFDSWPVADTSITAWALSTDTGVSKLTGANCADGPACIQISSGSYPSPQQWLYLPANTSITLSFSYKSNAANKPLNASLNDTTNNKTYNGSDWTTTTPISVCTAACATSWTDVSYTFNTNTTSTGVKYKLSFSQGSGTGINGIDKVSLTYANAVNWVSTGDGDGRTYSLSNVIPVGMASVTNHGSFSKATTAAWTASGLEALRPIYAAADLATCKSTPNTWWFASEVLYYHLAEDEDINDIHLQFGRFTVSKAGIAKGEAVSIDKNYITLNNAAIINGYTQGLKVAATGFIGNNILIRGSGIYNFELISGTATLNYLESSHGQNDGMDASGTGVLTANQAYVHHNSDEGIEAYTGGHIVCNYCISAFNGMNGDAGSEGIVSSNASSEVTVNNGTVYGNSGAGIGVADTAILTVINTASYGNGFNDVRAASGTTLTANHNIYGTAYDQWDALGGAGAGTQAGVDPLWVNPASGNFALQATSPAAGAGAIITGLHDAATAAKDLAGTDVTWGPSIGAYQPTPANVVYFDKAAAAGGNGTQSKPYNAMTDYPVAKLISGTVANPLYIYLKGDFSAEALDFSAYGGPADPYVVIRTPKQNQAANLGALTLKGSNMTQQYYQPVQAIPSKVWSDFTQYTTVP